MPECRSNFTPHLVSLKAGTSRSAHPSKASLTSMLGVPINIGGEMFYARSSAAAHLEGLTAAIRRAHCNPKKGVRGRRKRAELNYAPEYFMLLLSLNYTVHFLFTRARDCTSL